ncbi:hypothetical protein [Aliivibrio fischeri]|uniref:hypothetical protein n=1 Tax=Aliivibrio fischeri TaxID=668 RepID=UPI0007C4A778|nr:hypothetical protein [Aliivibrio fischeri]
MKKNTQTLNDAVATLLPYLFNNETNCPKQALKKAYKTAALCQHPDRNHQEEHKASMIGLNASWSIVRKATKEQLQILLDGLHGFKAPVKEWEVDPLRDAKVPSFETVETMLADTFKIVESLSDLKNSKYHMLSDTYYVKKENISISFFNGYWEASIVITDLTNALSSKPCKYIKLDRKGNEQHSVSIFHDIKELFFDFSSLDSELLRSKVDAVIEDFVVGKAMFSPFHLDRLKPLKELPQEWRGGNRQQLIRAIANGQYMEFTEDYYHEMDGCGAYDRGRSYIHNPMYFLKEAINNPKCEFRHIYSRGKKNGYVSFGPHSNQSSSLIVVIDNRFPLEDMKDDFEKTIKIEDNKKLGLAS